MPNYQIKTGFIEVIAGCMFSGKTEELIRRVHVYQRAKKGVLTFKPKFDNRQQETIIRSHSGTSLATMIITSPNDVEMKIKEMKQPIEVLAFDEAQFLDPSFCLYLEEKANEGYRIICAGLDKGFNDEKFTTMMLLLSQAEFVTKLMAVCIICGEMATKTQRIDNNGNPVPPKEVTNVIGGAKVYQARCRKCFKFFS